jgi:hypothetical protein
MNRRNKVVLVFVLGLATGAFSQHSFAQSNPWIGTWQLNLAKSKYSPGPPPRSLTVTMQAEGQGRRDTSTGVNAAGNPISDTFTIVFDGVPHPRVGSPNVDAFASTQIDAYTQIYSLTKAGKLIGTLTDEISPDGKTFTSTYTRINANGQKYSSFSVFDKQ